MSDEHRGLSHDMPEYVSNTLPRQPEPRRSYTVLCVGGPADGQWKTVDSRRFMVAEIPKFTFSTEDTDSIIEPFTQHAYHADVFSMLGFNVYVAVCEREFMGSAERNPAVLRALLQRDVAAQMGVL